MTPYQLGSKDMIYGTRCHIFISNQHTNKGLNPKINVPDDIYNIKRKSMLYVMVTNYTNKHITFNKGKDIRHMEPLIDKMSQTSGNSVITQKMMDEQVQPDIFRPPLQHLSSEVKQSLDELLDSFQS